MSILLLGGKGGGAGGGVEPLPVKLCVLMVGSLFGMHRFVCLFVCFSFVIRE